MSRKRIGEAIRFPAMIFSTQHAGNDGHLRTRRNKFPHQLPGKATIQPRFHANDSRSPASRSIGGYANYTDTVCFRAVDKRLQTLRIPCRKNDSVNAALHEFLESFGIIYAKSGYRTIYQLDPQRRHPTSFVQHTTPKLIIEKSNLPGYANADTDAAPRSGQGTRRQVRRVTDLCYDLQNPMAG